jgi:hypothetical protein
MMLSRAASILYRTWLSFREQTWGLRMSSITKIEDRGTSTTFHFGSTPEPKKPVVLQVSRTVTHIKEHTKEMLLSYCRCNDPYACPYFLATELFQGSFSTLTHLDAC